MAATRSSSSIEEIVKASEKRLSQLMSSVRDDLKESITEVKSEITELKTKVDSVEHDVAGHGNDISNLRSEMADLKKAYATLERQCILKDMHDRKPNLLFYGISEIPRENTEVVLKEFFKGKLKFPESRVNDITFKAVHRLPKSEYQREHRPLAPTSIIATFVKMSDRDDIFDAKKLLKGTGISIQTDLPAMMKKRRAILSRQANQIREDQKLWTRVRVVGTEVVLEVKEPHNPSSPWKKYE